MAESKARDIKNALVGLIEPLQLDGETAFVEVKGHPRGEFDGFPSVRVLPADVSSENVAFGENDRTVSFTVRTHLPVKTDGSEFDRMYELTDLLVDALEQADFDNTLQSQVGTYILTASRGTWMDVSTQSGVVLQCDIDVDVSYSKEL